MRSGPVTGSQLTLDHLLQELYDDLYRLARARTRRLPQWRTLCTGSLVHEAFMRLKRRDRSAWSCRAHFLADAKQAMHQIAVKYLRRKCALKRGALAVHTDGVSDIVAPQRFAGVDKLAVLEVLQRLQYEHPAAAELVFLRFYLGMTMTEITRVQGRSLRTVERTWRFARSWLETELL